ncbi:hypothetical protein ACQ4LE_005080 [Meloidogyne hapla]
MLILIFLLIFCNLPQCVFNLKINDVYVLHMADCYMKAFYQKPPLIPSSDVTQFDEAITPHLDFSDKIEDCLESIEEMPKKLFKKLKDLRESTKEKLEEEYKAKILKYAPFLTESSLRNSSVKREILESWRKNNEDKCEGIPKIFTRETKGKLKELYLNDMDNIFNRWRRQLSPFSLSLKCGYLTIAEDLIQKLLTLMGENGEDGVLIKTLQGMLDRIKKEIHTNTNIIEYSFLKDFFEFKETFDNLNKYLEKNLKKVNVIVSDEAPNVVPEFPKIKRVFWFVRHGERLDNNKTVKDQAKIIGKYHDEGREFELDNSPLSDTGKVRAAVLNQVFDNINIQHLFASPYERTVQTALYLLEESHKNVKKISRRRENITSELKIKLEPAFIESMTDCVDGKIGFDINDLWKHYQKSRIDWTYGSVYNKDNLKDFMKEEGRKSDISCSRRAGEVLTYLLQNLEENHTLQGFSNGILQKQIDDNIYQNDWLQPGEEGADQIVIVTHGLFLNSAINQIAGMFFYSPLTSILKVVELDPDSAIGHASSSGHAASSSSSTGPNYLENLRLVHFGATEQFVGQQDFGASYFQH